MGPSSAWGPPLGRSTFSYGSLTFAMLGVLPRTLVAPLFRRTHQELEQSMRDIPIPESSSPVPHPRSPRDDLVWLRPSDGPADTRHDGRVHPGGRAGPHPAPLPTTGADPGGIWLEAALVRLEALVADLRSKMSRRVRVVPVNDFSSPADPGGWLEALEEIAATALDIEFAAREAILRVKVAALQDGAEDGTVETASEKTG